MDTMNDLFLKAKIFFSTIHMPYKHNTVQNVYEDPDIENQYEKMCISGVVSTGNVSVNLLVGAIYLMKNIGVISTKYINEYLQKYNINNTGVNVVEESDINNEESDENNEEYDENNEEYEVVQDKKND
tara:strand:- start:293 stop:676 length:384 start_codon:yes stop_codon:yes gene_type:complete